MKEWNKKGGAKEEEGLDGGDTMEEAFIHCFYLVPCYYIRSIKTLSYAYIYMNCLSHSVPLTCSFAIMRERQRKAIHLSVAAP